MSSFFARIASTYAVEQCLWAIVLAMDTSNVDTVIVGGQCSSAAASYSA